MFRALTPHLTFFLFCLGGGVLHWKDEGDVGQAPLHLPLPLFCFVVRFPFILLFLLC